MHPRNDQAPTRAQHSDVPANPNLERELLAHLLNNPHHIHTTAQAGVRANTFHRPAHETLWLALRNVEARGQHIDPLTIAARIRETGDAQTFDGRPEDYLIDLYTRWTPIDPHWAAQQLNNLATLRRAATLATRLHQATTTWTDSPTHAQETINHLLAEHAEDEAHHHRTDTPTPLDVDTFIDTTDPEHVWLIPGILERGDRLIITGTEGGGKSTLLRQIAVQAAAGINPFTLTTTTPITVLLLDLENSQRQTRRKIRPLRAQAGQATDGAFDPTRLLIHCKPDGLNLTTDTDVDWLNQLLNATRPDLLITGPLYKLAGGDPTREEDTKPAAMNLDRIRTTHDVALILEAHSAKGQGQYRPKEPYGWSGWLRWPEFGFHIAADHDTNGLWPFTPWRGMRDERDFPEGLTRGDGQAWPWMPPHAHRRMSIPVGYDVHWGAIRAAIFAAGRVPPLRDLAEATGIGKSTVGRVLEVFDAQLQGLLRQMPAGVEDARHNGQAAES